MGAMRAFAVFGDSISTYHGWNPPGFAVFYDAERAAAAGLGDACDTWWALVADRLGGRVVANASYSGSMVAGEGFPAGWSPERVAALRGTDGAAPTDVLVFMGTNDYGWGSAHAQAAGRSAATPPCVDLAQVPEAVAGVATPADLAAFGEAYAAMLAAIRRELPDARVWCLSLLPGRVAGAVGPTFAWNLRGVPMDEYKRTIGRVAEDAGCRFVDASAFGLDYEAIDGTHPTALGMRQIAAMALAAMGEEPEGRGAVPADPRRALGDDPFAAGESPSGRDGWASRNLCPHRACLGCRHARGTGNAWSCVCERGRVRRLVSAALAAVLSRLPGRSSRSATSA